MASPDQLADEMTDEAEQLLRESTAELADGVTDEFTDGIPERVLVRGHARAIKKVWNWLDHPDFGQDPLHIPWSNITISPLAFPKRQRRYYKFWTIAEHNWVSWAIDHYAQTRNGGRISIKTLWEAFRVRFPGERRTLVAMRSYVQRTRDLRAKRMAYRM